MGKEQETHQFSVNLYLPKLYGKMGVRIFGIFVPLFPPSHKSLICRILDGFGSLLHFRANVFSLNIPTFECGSSLDALEMSKKIDF